MLMDATALKFLKKLLSVPTPSGYEAPGQEIVAEYLKPYADAIRRDAHGNLHAVKNPDAARRVMFSGHVDEIGLMIMTINDKGFLYAAAIGGVHAPSLIGERIVVHTAKGPVRGVIGQKPIHHMEAKERESAAVKITDLHIDIGAKDKKDAESMVALGDVATIDKTWIEVANGRIVARGLDDRAGVFAVAEALRLLAKDKIKVALHVVSSVQEEIGLRGATTAAFGIDPWCGVAVDVGFATDFPGAEAKLCGEATLGGGPILHRGANFNHALLKLLDQAAKDGKIATQMQPIPRGSGTDANAIQLSRAGVPAGLVSVPTRYMHTPVEMISLDDLENCAKLLARFVKNLTGRESFAQ